MSANVPCAASMKMMRGGLLPLAASMRFQREKTLIAVADTWGPMPPRMRSSRLVRLGRASRTFSSAMRASPSNLRASACSSASANADLVRVRVDLDCVMLLVSFGLGQFRP